MTDVDADAAARACECKVGRVAAAYECEDVHEELANRRRPPESTSLRDLADFFNRRVLAGALRTAGATPLDGEADNLYRLLTDDAVSSGSRVRARKRLEEDGVDVAALEERFVSHPTVGDHLTECLGVDPSRPSESSASAPEERIFKLQNRTEAVVRSTLDQLGRSPDLSAGTLSVVVDVRVSCRDCGAHAPVEEFLDGGGCECDSD